MDYIDEEEQESRFTKKDILKWLIFFGVMLILMVSIYLFLERMNKKGVDGEGVTKDNISTEEVNIYPEKPFILDDVKEEVKIEEKIAVAEDKKESVKKNLIDEKGHRICEYSEIDLPEIIESGSYIDVRLSLGDGRNYTVLSSKKTGDFLRKDGKEIVWLSLSDAEIVVMDSALSDLSLFEGAKLYAVLHNMEGMEEIKENYPLNYKSERLITKKKKEGGLREKVKITKDKELNEDRIRLVELKNGRIGRWKEAASYWEGQ